MIQKATLTFLHDLKHNNHKEWFDGHRMEYEAAKKDFIEFTQQIILGIAGFDPEIAAAHLDAKKCISRINRDIRFSKDKIPYKNNFFAMINQGGKKSNLAGYYVQIEPGSSFVGGGVYMPMPPDLQKLRQEIDYGFQEWTDLVEEKAFKSAFPKGIQSSEFLSRPPKGYEESNPAIAFLKMKGYYTTQELSDTDLTSENCIPRILEKLEIMQPLLKFLNKAL